MILKAVVELLLVLAISSLSIRNRKIIDEQGRQLTIHGTAAVVKVPPYQPRVDKYDPQWSFSQQDMVNCTKWGLNGLRLGMMQIVELFRWAGVEPQKDQYNQTYLDNMVKLVNMAGKHGIYTLIDFHQDLIAEKFCGDGIPTWLIDELKLYKTFPYPMGKKIQLNQSGLPSWDKCNKGGWGKYYLSYDVGATFNQLYRVGSRLNKKFSQFWIKIASKFKGNPYVLGYELINQPFVGNAIRDLLLLVPSIAEKFNLQNFYDNLAQEIRKIDEDAIIYFEPITFDSNVSVGFSHPPGGHRYANKSVLAYHYYSPPALGLGTIDHREKDGQRLGVPSFLTQFSGSNGIIMQRVQKNLHSWMYWQYKTYGKDWGSNQIVKQPLTKKLLGQWGIDGNHSMTYLQRTAGRLINQEFDFQSKHFLASYQATPGGTSVLYYCRQFNYQNGYELQLTPRNQLIGRQVRPGYYEINYTGAEIKVVQISIYAL